MTAFAGSLTGRTREEQVFVANGINQWVTYRVRGGAVLDGFFAPTTQTPYTDDLQLGYSADLGHNMSFETTYNYRPTRDILEDYDAALYATTTSGTTDYPGPINDPNSLFLGLDYFGFETNPGANFIIATLEGGERNYHGLELNLRKRFSNNWQAIASYNYNHATGNSNSDSNADFQGDVLELDPRAPNQYGRQPGSIEHLFKMSGLVRVQQRPRARRRLPLELGHDRQPDLPRVGPQPADSGDPAERLHVCRHPVPVDRSDRGRHARQSVVGTVRRAGEVQPRVRQDAS